MPTAARLTGAIAFAIVGYFIYVTMVPLYGEDVVPRLLLPLCMATGLWAGWVLCGKHADTISKGIGTGMTAVFAQTFWILLILAFALMLDRSLRKRYDGPVEAITDVFSLMYDDVLRFGTSEMGMVLLVGGLAGGIVTGYMGKKYPR